MSVQLPSAMSWQNDKSSVPLTKPSLKFSSQTISFAFVLLDAWFTVTVKKPLVAILCAMPAEALHILIPVC